MELTANLIQEQTISAAITGLEVLKGDKGDPGDPASATDVRINGTSITVDGVADVPLASLDKYGAVKSGLYKDGVYVDSNGVIKLQIAGIAQIDDRSSRYQPINPKFLDYAVKAAMCDGKGAAWTADEQSAARERMNAADANKVYIMQKQIENLQGIAATEETDSTEAYTKTVPAGAQKWASLDKVGGKTVVWNQLQPNSVSRSTAGITFSYENGTLTATADGSTRGIAWWLTGTATKISFKANHKYAILGIFPYDRTSDTGWYLPSAPGQVNLYDGDGIYTISADSETYLQLMICAEYDMSSPIVCKPQIFDLTTMFGAGNEPTDLSDQRIAAIMTYADAHPEYNPGELMSAEVVEVESRGKNLLDDSKRAGLLEIYFGTTEIKRAGITLHAGTYTFSVEPKDGDVTNLYVKDAVSNAEIAKKYSTKSVIFTINETKSLIVWAYKSTYNGPSDIVSAQIERGSTATDYKPYREPWIAHTVPQHVIDKCPLYGASAGTVCNEIDFASKKYIQRVESVDLGSLAWSHEDGYFSVRVNNLGWKTAYQAVCAMYQYTGSNIASNMSDMQASCGGSGLYLLIKNSAYTDAAVFKAAMAGVQLYYELAEPIEIDLSDVLPDDHFLEVEAGGTVTFKQASTQLPVPSSVTYQVSTKEAIANA